MDKNLNSMKITIIAIFTNSQTSRFLELANLFSENRHEVTLLTSDFSHITKRQKESMPQYAGFKTVYLHEPGYPNNVSIKRLYSHYRWGLEVEKYFKICDYPDVIYYAVPSLTAGSKIVDYCKRNKIKLAIDIQDLWPEAFSLMVKNKFLQLAFKPMEWLANEIYSNADIVIAVSNTYRDRGLSVNRKGKNGLTVYLGNHIDKFEEARLNFHKNKPTNEFWIAYIGTIGYSYDIPCVIDGISIFNQNNSSGRSVKLVAMGDGPLICEFKEYAHKKDVNTCFTGELPYEEMVGLMCSCDIVVNPIRKGAAQSITNKVGDYAFSGLAVINTQECQEYRELIEKYECGINCECENSEQLANAINTLILNPDLCRKMGNASMKLGKEKFDRKFTYPLIIKAVENLL